MALHLTLASVNMVVRNHQIDHCVFLLEGKSWRKDVYEPYKKNRVVDAMSVTEEEKAENEMFWDTYAKFTEYLSSRTNCSVLRQPRAEADDLIARFIHLHPNDNHYIVSSDTDFLQLISKNVFQYNGITNELIRPDGYFKDNGKPVIDKKTKQPKLLEDPEYLKFLKIVRGDSSDNVFSCYPGVREKGTKNKIGIREAFEDRNRQGFSWNSFMLARWLDHNDTEHRVRDDYERNRMLIDLTAQPDEIKELVDNCIKDGVRTEITPQVGLHFLKFCGRYDLQKLSENAEVYSRWLSAPYTGVLHEQSIA